MEAKDWAAAVFDDAARRANEASAPFRATAVKKGAHNSSRYALDIAQLYEKEAEVAIDRCLSLVGDRFDTRGADWENALKAIENGLAVYISASTDYVEKRVRPEFRGIAAKHLQRVSPRLQFLIDEFRAGWTAPRPKTWNERHPFLYAIALLFLGALVGQAFELLAQSVG